MRSPLRPYVLYGVKYIDLVPLIPCTLFRYDQYYVARSAIQLKLTWEARQRRRSKEEGNASSNLNSTAPLNTPSIFRTVSHHGDTPKSPFSPSHASIPFLDDPGPYHRPRVSRTISEGMPVSHLSRSRTGTTTTASATQKRDSSCRDVLEAEDGIPFPSTGTASQGTDVCLNASSPGSAVADLVTKGFVPKLQGSVRGSDRADFVPQRPESCYDTFEDTALEGRRRSSSHYGFGDGVGNGELEPRLQQSHRASHLVGFGNGVDNGELEPPHHTIRVVAREVSQSIGLEMGLITVRSNPLVSVFCHETCGVKFIIIRVYLAWPSPLCPVSHTGVAFGERKESIYGFENQGSFRGTTPDHTTGDRNFRSGADNAAESAETDASTLASTLDGVESVDRFVSVCGAFEKSATISHIRKGGTRTRYARSGAGVEAARAAREGIAQGDDDDATSHGANSETFQEYAALPKRSASAPRQTFFANHAGKDNEV